VRQQNRSINYIFHFHFVFSCRIFNSFDDAKFLYLIWVLVVPVMGLISRVKKTKSFTGLRRACWLWKAVAVTLLASSRLLLVLIAISVSALIACGIVNILIPLARKKQDYTVNIQGAPVAPFILWIQCFRLNNDIL
jgi:hypothetical protein